MHLIRRASGWLHEPFLALDLRGKITASLLAASLVMGVLTTATAYLLARHQIAQQTRELLESRAMLEQRELELRLSGVLALADSIAVNTVTANALADSLGREIYLDPLLRHQNLAIPGASLSVVDYRGRNVASSIDSPPADFGGQASFRNMTRTGKAAMENIAPGTPDAALLVALPIHYRLTGNTEGAVMLRIPLAPLLNSAGWADARWLADQAGTILIGRRPVGDAFEFSATLRLPAPLDAQALTLVLARDRAAALHILDILLAVFLSIGLLVVVGVVLFAHYGARYITAPLGELAAAAEEIAASGRPVGSLPVRRADEFGRLSAAFNTMVQRLQESYGELEDLVTERTRNYEESQQDAEKAIALLREAVRSIAVGFTIYDEEDRLVLCNEAYLRLYEESRDLIVPGSRFSDIVRRGAERGQYAEAIGNIDAWVKQRVELHQNADGIPIEQQLGDGRWLLVIEHRTPSGYIVGNRIDITELKRTTEALTVREARIRDRNEQLDAIFALSPDGFVSFDAARRVKYANPSFLSMTGLIESDIVGLDEAEFSGRLARECLPSARFPGIAALLGGSSQADGKGEERRHLIELLGAAKRVIEVGARRSHADTVSQILYFRDVTHETEVDRLKSEFLSTAAHELRTPMACIYGFSELMLSDEYPDDEKQEFLGAIFRQSELMIAIINELLDLARIEARRGKDFNLVELDAGELLRQTIANFKFPNDRSPPREIGLDGQYWIRADRNKLMQSLGNVLSNAYKYSPDGGEISLELIGPAADSPRIGIRVTDHGIGMTPAQLARVCERFYRADTSGKIPGTGLGMSIVKEIVELHGGEVGLTSQPGAGTTVTMWLPVA